MQNSQIKLSLPLHQGIALLLRINVKIAPFSQKYDIGVLRYSLSFPYFALANTLKRLLLI